VGLLLSARPAAAATCPSVDPSTGAVSPAAGAGTQWPGCDLSGADLSGANLSSANLYGADLQGANLSGANLTQTGLMTADLSGANLTGADMMQTMLDGATLSGATLTGVSSDLISGTPAFLPLNWILVNSYLVGPGANLEFAGLVGADLSNADLSGVNLTDAKLAQATLTGASLAGATLAGVSSGSITGAPAALPVNWSLHNGYLVGPGADLYMADLHSQDLSGLTLTGIDLNGSTLANANLSGTDLTAADLGFTNLTGTNLAGATLAHVQSGSIMGTPSALPANWLLKGGYLIGPKADLQGVAFNNWQLSGVDLSGADLSAAGLIGANLSKASLTGANLTGASVDRATLTGANFSKANLTASDLSLSALTGANFAGANLTWAGASDVTLTHVNLSSTNLTNANFNYVNLADANFDYANLTLTELYQDTTAGATFLGAHWLHATCPNGSSSDKHVKGCFTPLDTTPPAVAVTGVSNGKVYVTGAVPAAHCTTTDNGTVATPAAPKVTTTGKNGVGRFTATCSGAVDLAGNKQKAPVSVTFTVGYGVHGFIAPANGATTARSAKTIHVQFRLTSAGGTAISAALAQALAAAHDIRVTLQGPGITAVTAYCGWNVSPQDLTCAVAIPAGARTGSAQKYTLTVAENVGTGFVTIPAVLGAADPEVIHFT
jgi:uncharacterized protein YjbI with pentapeptide repeats